MKCATNADWKMPGAHGTVIPELMNKLIMTEFPGRNMSRRLLQHVLLRTMFLWTRDEIADVIGARHIFTRHPKSERFHHWVQSIVADMRAAGTWPSNSGIGNALVIAEYVSRLQRKFWA
jgi:hypothetical protein